MDNPGFIPMSFPIIYGGNQSPRVIEEIPANVRTALIFLNDLTHKTSEKVAVNGMSIETFGSQTLTREEADTRLAACNLLKRYFDQGDFDYGKGERDVEMDGVVVNCPGCVEEVNTGCPVCCGSGRVIVSPLKGKQ